jgi:hypothetical protein
VPLPFLSRKILWAGICAGVLASSVAAWPHGETVVLMKEDFDTESDAGLAAVLLEDPEIRLAPGKGPDGSDAIRVAYVGYERGSRRVTRIFGLEGSVTTATLSYDVCFKEGFQFVKGGKLHGLSPKIPVTGGQDRTPQGWSARVIFRQEGHAGAYLYDQNPDKKWGVGGKSSEQVFFPGCWHHVDLQVHLNDAGLKNGWSRIFVDGHEVVATEGIAFRAQEGPETLIQRFLFSTFHGGSTPDCAPVDEEGNFMTIYALFDNFLVIEGVQEIVPTHCREN